MSEYDIFISHDSRDKEVAGLLKEFLEDIFLQSSVYVSGENINGGDSWFDSIVSALKQSKVIISLISMNSIDNNWVYFETGAGVSEGKSIPLLGDNLEFSELAKYPVSSIQTRKFNSEGIPRLISDVAKLLDVRLPKRENISGIDELVKECDLIFVRLRSKDLTERLKKVQEDRVEDTEEDDFDVEYSVKNRDLHEKIEKVLEKTRVHLKSHWIEISNRKNQANVKINGVHKLDIPQLYNYLLSRGITSEVENFSNFMEAEKISLVPSKNEDLNEGIEKLNAILDRIRPLDF